MKRERNTKKKEPKRATVDSMHVSIRWIALDIMIRHTAYTVRLNRAESCREDRTIQK